MATIEPEVLAYAERMGVDLTTAQFPDGYGSTTRTMERVASRNSVQLLARAFRIRIFGIMIWCYAHGIAYGIGGAARAFAQQEAEAYRRHQRTPNGRRSRWYKGVRWFLRKGMASYAFPGGSNHEEGATPDGAVAADMVPSASWKAANAIAHLFWLKDFTNVNSEPWHLQPSEWPNSRSGIRKLIAKGQRLATRPLPGGSVISTPTPPDPTDPTVYPPAPKATTPGARTVSLTVTLTYLTEGTKGQDALRAQGLMNALSGPDANGNLLDEDGDYGPISAARCRDIQAFLGAHVDGEIGPQTWGILIDL